MCKEMVSCSVALWLSDNKQSCDWRRCWWFILTDFHMQSRRTYSINELKYLHERFSFYQMTNGERFIPLNCYCKKKICYWPDYIRKLSYVIYPRNSHFAIKSFLGLIFRLVKRKAKTCIKIVHRLQRNHYLPLGWSF